MRQGYFVWGDGLLTSLAYGPILPTPVESGIVSGPTLSGINKVDAGDAEGSTHVLRRDPSRVAATLDGHFIVRLCPLGKFKVTLTTTGDRTGNTSCPPSRNTW